MLQSYLISRTTSIETKLGLPFLSLAPAYPSILFYFIYYFFSYGLSPKARIHHSQFNLYDNTILIARASKAIPKLIYSPTQEHQRRNYQQQTNSSTNR